MSVCTLMLAGLGAAATFGPATARTAEPELERPREVPISSPSSEPTAEPATSPTTTDPALTEPEPEPEPVCEPACPSGSVCMEGQCFIACDPSTGECDEATAEPEPEPEPEPLPTPEPAIEIEPADPEEPTVARGLDLLVAPTVAACLGSGCRNVQVGNSSGGIGLGGGLDLRLSYRATPHLSLDLGTITAFHGNDIDSDPFSMWTSILAGPRLHLSGGRWRAEPVVGLRAGYVRSLVRWTNAGVAADALALSADVGVLMTIHPRISLGMMTSVVLPYWTRVCDADSDILSCYSRSELTNNDLRRYFWTTSVVLVARLF